MTPEDIQNKVNGYLSNISSFENQMNSKISQRESYELDSEEYENLTVEIDKLESKIYYTKMVIGLV